MSATSAQLGLRQSTTEPSMAGRSVFYRDAKLALRLLAREWRSGELRVLVIALLVAVSGISAVGFFVDRMERAMESRASVLLAADLLVTSRDVIPEELERKANRLGLETARTLTTRSVVVTGDNMALTEVKAVTPGYPLRGELREAQSAFGEDQAATSIPSAGTAWLEGRLLATLGLEVGDAFNLGAQSFVIDRVITVEPDRGGDLFSIAPRVMINMADLAATSLVQPGSRVRHRLLFAGPGPLVTNWRGELSEQITDNMQIQGVRTARPELRRALERAGQFLGLAALVGVMLAGAAIAVSASRHADRHLDTAALMRCFGAQQATVVRIYGLQLVMLALGAGLVGSLLGYLGQFGLAELIGGLVVKDLPAAGVTPVAAGMAVAIVTLGGFGVPPLARLRNVPPARVLRRDLGGVPLPAWAMYGASFVALSLIAWWQAGYWLLAALVVGGTLGTLVTLALGALALVKTATLMRSRLGPAGRFAIAGLSRRKAASVVQVVAFGLGMLALMLLALVRGSLLDEWRNALPDNAPNFFLINIAPDEVDSLSAFMVERGIEPAEFHPFIRARITALNGEPFDSETFDDPRAKRLGAREHNLSFSTEKPGHNEIVDGQWWDTSPSASAAEFSVEARIANTLNLKLGDKLTFHVAGVDVEGTLTSTRTVDWESFKINFFFIGHPDLLQGQPSTYATSFHLDPDKRQVLADVVRQFPSVTVMDVDSLMTQVRGIMNHASTGIEYVFGFTLLAGLMVMLATIQSTLDDRRRESAVLRTLGARRKLLVNALLIEFALLGALAGILSGVAANAVAIVIADQIFGFSLSMQPQMLLIGVVVGSIGVAFAGYLGTRSVLNQPPLWTLRET
jgi:putative ABC transport system permease protein